MPIDAAAIEKRARELLAAEMLKRYPGPGMPGRVVATTWPNDMFPAATLEVALAALRSQREEVVRECANIANGISEREGGFKRELFCKPGEGKHAHGEDVADEIEIAIRALTKEA